jgi:hypothetical protein
MIAALLDVAALLLLLERRRRRCEIVHTPRLWN